MNYVSSLFVRRLVSGVSRNARNLCSEQLKCWNCSGSVSASEFFCTSCHVVQPIGKRNLYDCIGLPVAFSVNETDLKSRFREMQFKLHPDKFASASKEEKEISDNLSRTVNEAYKTLSEPLPRAKYLLKLKGEQFNKGDNLDQEALMEMMEWNELVASLKGRSALEAEVKNVNNRIKVLVKELDKYFSSDDIEKARSSVVQLGYMYSIRTSISKKIHDSL